MSKRVHMSRDDETDASAVWKAKTLVIRRVLLHLRALELTTTRLPVSSTHKVYFHLLELKNASVAGIIIVATARAAAERESPHPKVSPMSLVPMPHANRAGAPSKKLMADFLRSGHGAGRTAAAQPSA